MDSTVYSTPPTNSISLAEAIKIAEARFEAAVQGCKDDWHNGNDLVILQDNIPQLFGGILVEHFKRCVGEVCGFPVELTVMDGGDNYHTLVQMPKNNMRSPQVVSSPQSAQTSPSEQTSINLKAVAAGLKKAPRPMNCWIIFRDAMHKHLKAEFPHLTIQEISTRCSHIWHNLSPEAKKPWQDAAQSAKEEHLRQHPNYKYTPRKPGEKKKRQSRKSKRAAAMTTAPEVLQFQLSPKLIPTVPEVTDEPPLAANPVTANGNNACPEDVSNCFDPNVFPEIYPEAPMAADFFYNAESIRHSLLDTEFDIDFNMDTTFALFDDEMLAFRDGADGDATLPSLFEDTY
ncbi:hypothetical protein COCC4DRAFT_125132 [Bipolaris maydis ATCC 48331]|uniref:HMG box domain-containing protein n=1 Tax=Cochliobolus heterostrophus (strain C4 / ATCC 48331 / race T) TaxID=665024 RepID=N4X9N7_COCH4|nr:uncharacterized protein COCC4DRAFT_125132 [Bipolaris maydis ATCC 48331]ENI09744.1 hypothetical protein COCC4DRAFT_125132 [Bipolaris maydis ATCC 48331]KAH7563130.1 hypothetical protein BM1_00177 [Bipolaris maydis]KAJ5063876.1 mating-type protein MAT-2 [Bipolaris maydis]KAJ6269506.1 high mobility group box-domain-containing protein [Bipolaris maydis]